MSFLYEYIIKHLFYAKLKEVGHKHRTNHCCECCFVDVGVVLHCFDCRFDDLFYLELFAKVDFTKNFVECHFDVNSRLFLKCCTRFMKWFIMIWYWTYLLIQTKPFFLLMQDFFYNEIEIQFEVCLHVIVVTADSCFFFCIICKNSIMNLGRFYQLLLQSHVWDWKVLLHKIFFFVILKMIYFANLPTCTTINIIHWVTKQLL